MIYENLNKRFTFRMENGLKKYLNKWFVERSDVPSFITLSFLNEILLERASRDLSPVPREGGVRSFLVDLCT